MSDDDFSDDIDDGDLDFDDEFEDFDSEKQKTLGDLWRETPALKLGSVVLGLIVFVFLFSVFTKKEETPLESHVAPASNVSAAPGTENASPAYIEAIVEENETRVEEAVREGGSALPTPIEPPIGRLTVPEEEEAQEDPLQRWRRLQEERLERELQQAQMVTQSSAVEDVGLANAETLTAMSEAMSEQMGAILERHNEDTTMSSLSITAPDYLETLHAAAQEAAEEEEEEENAEIETLTLIPAAEIEYAQLLIEANSDVPGPVLAQIISGPLSGARALGSFAVQEDLLTLTFTSAVKDGETIPLNGIALDPATSLPAMATEVNHRYFRRIILPAAAAFIEGTAQAISESGRTTITVSGDTVTEETEEADDEQEIASGIEEVGQELGEIIDEWADVKTLVKIHAGTPMAILFLDPVTIEVEPDDETTE